MSKNIVIIGAGIAGLTAGIYAKRNGFEVTIVEQHTIPGGACTSWKRKGYLFEGAIHWLTGSSPKTTFYELWNDVGALDENIKVRYDEPFKSLEWEGKTVNLYRDLQSLHKHFDEISPEDAKTTKRLISDIRAMTRMEMPVMDIKGVKSANPRKMSIGKLIKMFPALLTMNKLSKLSVDEYAAGFKHPAFRQLINTILPEDYSAVALLSTLSWLAMGDGGYPEGGSLAMTQRMADTYKSLGGKLLLGTKADKVIINNGAATGVSVNGKILPADAIIVTQEILAAVERLFDTPPKDKWLLELKRNIKPATCCFIGIGVRASIPETPAFQLSEPIQCGGFSYPVLSFNNYTGYPGYAPDGCTTLTVPLMGDSYDFWKKARDEGRYEAEKQNVADQVSKALCQKYPQAKGNIDIIDVATPLTYERYTGASKGSWMAHMSKGDAAGSSCPCTLENIKGVYFAGHRTMVPGGMPVALSSGRNAAQMVCRQFDTIFR